jgi:hypothetical protein
MKDSYLINFSLFCLKRKFNLLAYLTANEEVTYDQFCVFMRSKSVCPPNVEFFNKTKDKALSINLSKKAESDLLENSKKNFDKEVTNKEEKPKRKRRSRKKSEKKNDIN